MVLCISLTGGSRRGCPRPSLGDTQCVLGFTGGCECRAAPCHTLLLRLQSTPVSSCPRSCERRAVSSVKPSPLRLLTQSPRWGHSSEPSTGPERPQGPRSTLRHPPRPSSWGKRAQWETGSHGYLVAEVGFQLGSLCLPPTPAQVAVVTSPGSLGLPQPHPALPGLVSAVNQGPFLPTSLPLRSQCAGGQHSTSELAACRVVGRAAVRVLTLAHLCKRGPSATVENFGAGELRARGPFHSHEERSCLVPPRRPSPGRRQDDTALQ